MTLDGDRYGGLRHGALRLAVIVLILLVRGPLVASAATGEAYVEAFNTIIRMLNDRRLAADPSAEPLAEKDLAKGEGVEQWDLYNIRLMVERLMKTAYVVPMARFDLGQRIAYDAFPPALRYDSGVLHRPSLMEGIGNGEKYTKVPGPFTVSGETIYASNFSDVPVLWVHLDELFKIIDAMRFTCTQAPVWTNATGMVNYYAGDIGTHAMDRWGVVTTLADANYALSGEVRSPGYLEAYTYGFGMKATRLYAFKKKEFYSLRASGVSTRVPHRFHFFNYAKAPPHDSSSIREFNAYGAPVGENRWTHWDSSSLTDAGEWLSRPLGQEADVNQWCPEPGAPWPGYFRYMGYFIAEIVTVVEWDFETPSDWRPPVIQDSEQDGLVAQGCECVTCPPRLDPVWLAMLKYPLVKWPLGLSCGLTTCGIRVQAYLSEYMINETPRQMFSLDTAIVGGGAHATEGWSFALVKRPMGPEVLFALTGSLAHQAVNLSDSKPYRLHKDSTGFELEFRDLREVVHRFSTAGQLMGVRATVNGLSIAVDRVSGEFPKLHVEKSAQGTVARVTSPLLESIAHTGNDGLVDRVDYRNRWGWPLASSAVFPGSRVFKQWDAEGQLVREFHVEARGGEGVETHYETGSGLAFTRTRRADLFDDATATLSVVETRAIRPGLADASSNVTVRGYQRFPWGFELMSESTEVASSRYIYGTNGLDATAYGRLERMEEGDGGWVQYDYDEYGRVRRRVSPFKNSLPEEAPGKGRSVECVYAGDPVLAEQGYPEDALDSLSFTQPRLEVTLIDGHEVSRTWRAYFNDRCLVKRAAEVGARYDSSNALVTTTHLYTEPPLRGRPRLIEHEDGTRSAYFYEYDGTQTQMTFLVMNGFGSDDVVTAGTMTETVVDALDRPLRETRSDIESGIVLSDVRYDRDGLGRPTRVADLVAGTETITTYGCCGPETMTDADGLVTHMEYDPLGRMIAQTRFGVTTAYRHDADGQVVEERQSADGMADRITTYEYDAQGRLVAIADPGGGHITYSYASHDAGGEVVTETAPDGATQISTFFRDGSLSHISGTGVRPFCYDLGCDENGSFTVEYHGQDTHATQWVKTVSDRFGRTIRTEYPDGYTATYSYDARGRVVRESDGWITRLREYGENDTLVRDAIDMNGNGVIDGEGEDRITETVWRYVNIGGTNVRETVTRMAMEANRAILATVSVQRITLDGLMSWSWSHGREERMHIEKDPAHVARVETRFRADGTRLTSSFSSNRLVDVAEFAGDGALVREVSYDYDALGRTTKLRDRAPTGAARETVYEYDIAGHVTGTTVSVEGLVRTVADVYDRAGRRVRTIRPGGGTVEYQYDGHGNLAAQYGAGVCPVRYTYDGNDRLVALATYRQGFEGEPETTRWTYDGARGWLSARTYADGSTVAYDYHANGMPRARRWTRGVETDYHYDAAGDLVGLSYSDRTPPVSWIRDRRGRPVTVTDALGEHHYAYADAGQVRSHTLPSAMGVTIEYRHDRLGRRTGLCASIGNDVRVEEAMAFDDAGRLATVSNGWVTASYGYGSDGATIVGRDVCVNGVAALGVIDRYDGLDRLVETSTQSAAGEPFGQAFDYDTAGRRVKSTLTNGDYWLYAYDGQDQLIEGRKYYADDIPVGGAQFRYTYDTAGNRRSSSRMGGRRPPECTYTMNELNQCTAISEPGVALVTGRADVGARVTAGLAGGVASMANRHGEDFWCLLPVDNSASAVYVTNVIRAVVTRDDREIVRTETRESLIPPARRVCAYDPDGNLVSDGVFANTWDAENRLIVIESLPDIPEAARIRREFDYDYTGRCTRDRSFKSVAGQWIPVSESLRVYDGWTVISEIRRSFSDSQPPETRVTAYTWGPDVSGSSDGAAGVGGLVATHSDTNVWLAVYDGNGNIIGQLCPDGRRAAVFDYGPFGEVLRASGPEAASNPWRFSTRYTDAETGLVMYPRRPYSPTLGRFLSRDPIEEAGGMNLYGFVGNAPLNFVDPWGFAIYAFDGTWNDAEKMKRPTNVAKLAKVYRGEVWYEKGVGTDWYTRLIGGMTGAGGENRIERMYRELVRIYNTPDPTGENQQIDVIGFSRGAALARTFVNYINRKGGVPLTGPDGKPSGVICPVTIRFLGLFDTVASFGLPGNNINWEQNLAIPVNVKHVRHAVSQDEKRGMFPLSSVLNNPNAPFADPRIVEQGFPGAHSDIGGGYEGGDRSNDALMWMHDEGIRVGVPFGPLAPGDLGSRNPILHDERGWLGRTLNRPREIYYLNARR